MGVKRTAKSFHFGGSGRSLPLPPPLRRRGPDATLRTTIATATNESRRLPFDEQLALRCPGFVRAADHLRAAAAATGHAYAPGGTPLPTPSSLAVGADGMPGQLPICYLGLVSCMSVCPRALGSDIIQGIVL